jgi:phosphoribosylaminoimidazolecarboxamide formyltransferase/IMP cyclohydrolase
MSKVAMARALVSVYDKTGLADLARVLAGAGIEIVSTGSTAQLISAAGIPVTSVEAVTGFPECLDGRVKTLHPAVHAGLLADVARPAHAEQLGQLGIAPFQLLVSNLYPFEQAVASGAAPAECVEQIDIGGPAMVRAAAKNHASVAVITSPSMYADVAVAVADGGFTLEQRRRLAGLAYAHTAAYDAAVASWFAARYAPDQTARDTGWPAVVGTLWSRHQVLRYGENPHQRAALYLPGTRLAARPGDAAAADSGAGTGDGAADRGELTGTGQYDTGQASIGPLAGTGSSEVTGVAGAVQLAGKPMSYNNYTDADAARRAVFGFAEPCVAIMKHSNPCGIAVGADLAEAHRKAHACDPESAFGGVIAANGVLTAELAGQIAEIFTEVIIAPGFEPAALDILTRKKNQRVLRCPAPAAGPGIEWRQVSGGLLMQSADQASEAGDAAGQWQLAAGPPASEPVLADLAFAWRACRAVKSNAILLASGQASVGIGMGQVNRVDAARLAVRRAGDRAAGSVAASDAYFPFPDGLQVLADAGVRAVAEPGGSVRDGLVIEAAQAAGITLYLTGVRHFLH